MLIITIEVNARPGPALSNNEDMTLLLGRDGDARGISGDEGRLGHLEAMALRGRP